MAVDVKVDREANGQYHVLIDDFRHYYMDDFDGPYLQSVLANCMPAFEIIHVMNESSLRIEDIKKADTAEAAAEQKADDNPAVT